MYVAGAPTVTSVTVTPATATVVKGQNLKMAATVVTTNFAPKSVNWTVTGGNDAATTIDIYGNLHVSENETAASLTVTATSTFDDSKSNTATITVSSFSFHKP